MQLTLIHTILATLALKGISGVALPEPQPPASEKCKIADSELGPVCSTVDPIHRRDIDLGLPKRSPEPVEKYKIADSELGPVYSTVNPNHRRDFDHDLLERSEAYAPLDVEEASKYMEEKLHPTGKPTKGQVNKRDDAPLEKRDWAACVACMAACGLLQQGIPLLSMAQQVQSCLGNCVLQGACSPYFRAQYQDYYGNTFPPPPAPAGGNGH